MARIASGEGAPIEASAGGSAPEPVVLDARAAERLVVPGDDFLVRADYSRSGPDLVLTGRPDEAAVVVRDYFSAGAPDLHTEWGGRIGGDLAQKLAGPQFAAQYAQAAPAAAAGSIGTVETLDGTVTATRADGSTVTLAVGDPVFEGDVIETGGASLIQIIFNDGAEFLLEEDARMTLDEMVYTGGSNDSLGLSVVKGVFAFVSGEVAAGGEDAMTIRTPVATLGIRGTEGGGQVTAEGQNNIFTVIKGIIAVINAAGTTILDTVNATSQVTSFFAQPGVAEILTPQALENMFGARLVQALGQAQQRAIEREQQRQQQEQQDDGQDGSSGDQQGGADGDGGDGEGASERGGSRDGVIQVVLDLAEAGIEDAPGQLIIAIRESGEVDLSFANDTSGFGRDLLSNVFSIRDLFETPPDTSGRDNLPFNPGGTAVSPSIGRKDRGTLRLPELPAAPTSS